MLVLSTWFIKGFGLPLDKLWVEDSVYAGFIFIFLSVSWTCAFFNPTVTEIVGGICGRFINWLLNGDDLVICVISCVDADSLVPAELLTPL